MLSGEKILVTGVTGTATLPIAEFLARENEVWGLARFSDPEARRHVESIGITIRSVDLAQGDLSEVPDDFTYVLHFAHTRMPGGDFIPAIQVNAVGAGHVLQHCRKAKGALVASAGTVYSPHNEDVYRPFVEEDDIGRAHAPWAPTSPASKVSLEAVARFCAEAFSLPTTIVRLNVVYGPLGGMPVNDMELIARNEPVMAFADPYPASPIHADDMCNQVEALLDAASSPALIVNWCGDEVITLRQWCEVAGEICGVTPEIKVHPVPTAACGSVGDTTRRMAITGPCQAEFRVEMEKIYHQRFARPAV
ncbi:MAG: NAD(P)-dependent oxidoreductase [Deltaproteobacteria bacterium]|jgi:nucleoside-diphosphate-sugar epimerase|nr:NAD(P)-dependent oxidoreductase [Deltaproteobacteria bacterium]MBW2498634.1 NAD(P)-dependent oxidoreductase [Deltaproteobacteria bacterium]